jgi:arylsulfatase A-like enzyme
LRSLLSVDDLVETVIATLDETGTLDNTYVVFTSDNGYDLGDHRQMNGKGTPYETAIHVPLLVRGPGVEEGRVEERLVVNTDFGPTFAELAGTEPPEFVDGRSIVPLLRGEDVPWRQAVLSQFTDHYYVLTLADRTFIAHNNQEGVLQPLAKEDARELYDLVADPYQLDNLAADPERRVEVAALDAWLTPLSTCAAADCRALEDGPPAGT